MREAINALTASESAEQLLTLYDEDFVRCAYLSVLRRPADPMGLAGYLEQVRLGVNRAEILVALATSPEGRKIGAERLPGLTKIIIATPRRRNSLFSRIMSLLASGPLTPITARLQGHEFRLNKHAELTARCFENVGRDIETLFQASGNGIAQGIQEDEELKCMTVHARMIYFQLRESAKRHALIERP
jgi:hypothetical protein